MQTENRGKDKYRWLFYLFRCCFKSGSTPVPCMQQLQRWSIKNSSLIFNLTISMFMLLLINYSKKNFESDSYEHELALLLTLFTWELSPPPLNQLMNYLVDMFSVISSIAMLPNLFLSVLKLGSLISTIVCEILLGAFTLEDTEAPPDDRLRCLALSSFSIARIMVSISCGLVLSHSIPVLGLISSNHLQWYENFIFQALTKLSQIFL